MAVELALFIAGTVILLGFAARILFERSHVPDVLILMGVGVLLGHFISPEARAFIYRLAPYVGTLALIMILFEGGLHIDPDEAVAQMPAAAALSSLTLGVTALAMTALANLAWGWALLPSMLLGIVLGCTSSAIVMPVAWGIAMPSDTRTLVSLESAFSDTFAIVALVTLMGLAETPGGWLASGVGHVIRSFGLATVVAVIGSVAWLLVLEYTKRRPLSYLLTFAVLILLYAAVESMRGSGAITVLIFGVLVKESKRLPKWLFMFGKPPASMGREEAHATLQWFHQEMTFLVRTFFFVYLGLLFEARRLTAPIVWASLALCGLVVTGRWAVVHLLRWRLAGQPAWLVGAFLPRGLVSAVLATLPAAHGIPGTARFLDYTVPLIILTNLLMAAGLVFASRAGDRSDPAAEGVS